MFLSIEFWFPKPRGGPIKVITFLGPFIITSSVVNILMHQKYLVFRQVAEYRPVGLQ